MDGCLYNNGNSTVTVPFFLLLLLLLFLYNLIIIACLLLIYSNQASETLSTVYAVYIFYGYIFGIC